MDARNVNPRPDYPRPPAPPTPPPAPGSDASIAAALTRIERKLDTLIAALAADEEEDQPVTDLEGQEHGRERDGSQSLG
jgi:hypothetical protein